MKSSSAASLITLLPLLFYLTSALPQQQQQQQQQPEIHADKPSQITFKTSNGDPSSENTWTLDLCPNLRSVATKNVELSGTVSLGNEEIERAWITSTPTDRVRCYIYSSEPDTDGEVRSFGGGSGEEWRGDVRATSVACEILPPEWVIS